MDSVQDLYPSRTAGKLPLFHRPDPVIHSQGAARLEGPLSVDELNAFDGQGYLFYPGFFEQAEIELFQSELTRLSRDPAVRESGAVILEPKSREVRSVFAIHRLSPAFDRLSRDPRILGRVQQLLGSAAYIHQSRINYKPGFQGKGFNWHSDFETWHAEDGMPRPRAVSCSISLTENHEFNGPLMVVPGSHKFFVPCVGATPEDNYKRSLQDQQVGVPDEDSLRELIDRGGIVAPKGPPGSLLLFECNLLHASNANLSPTPRSNVFFVYNSIDNTLQQPYAAKRPRPAFLAERSPKALTPLA